jgi:hypothetical protein
LFCGRHFEDVIILLCVRWYLRYSLSYRDLEEIMAERGLSVDHVTIWRWVQRYGPILNQRIRRELKNRDRSWRVDETYVKVAGNWAYLYRAVDSAGETIEFMWSPKRDLIAAKLFPRLALSTGGCARNPSARHQSTGAALFHSGGWAWGPGRITGPRPRRRLTAAHARHRRAHMPVAANEKRKSWRRAAQNAMNATR